MFELPGGWGGTFGLVWMELLFPIFHLAEGFNLGEVSLVCPLWHHRGMTQRATPDRRELRLSVFKTKKSETSDKLALGTSCWMTSTLISYIITPQVTNSTLNLGVWMQAPRQSGDASAESWRRTRGGQDALVYSLSPSVRGFYSPLVHWSRKQGFHLTAHSVSPGLPAHPSCGVGRFLLMHVLKTALIKKKMFVWFVWPLGLTVSEYFCCTLKVKFDWRYAFHFFLF